MEEQKQNTRYDSNFKSSVAIGEEDSVPQSISKSQPDSEVPFYMKREAQMSQITDEDVENF